jgi:hypothetical protein
MSLFQSLLRIFPSVCRHRHTYRERRKLHGVLVMHFVCENCGHAVPAMERTAKEHREVVKVGDQSNTRLVRQPGHVVAMSGRSRRKPA